MDMRSVRGRAPRPIWGRLGKRPIKPHLKMVSGRDRTGHGGNGESAWTEPGTGSGRPGRAVLRNGAWPMAPCTGRSSPWSGGELLLARPVVVRGRWSVAPADGGGPIG